MPEKRARVDGGNSRSVNSRPEEGGDGETGHEGEGESGDEEGRRAGRLFTASENDLWGLEPTPEFSSVPYGEEDERAFHALEMALDEEQFVALMEKDSRLAAAAAQRGTPTASRASADRGAGVETRGGVPKCRDGCRWAVTRARRIEARKVVPALAWGKQYKREWLSGDILAGCTVAVLMIPQAISYALLAGLAPQYGLYSSIFPVVIYSLLGSSRHMHIGPFAIVSLMVASACESLLGRQGPAITRVDDPEYVSLTIALCFIVGLQQCVLGLFRAGGLTVLLSDPIVSGVTTAAACFVATSQMKHLFGLSVPSYSDPGSLFRTYVYLFAHLDDTNVAALVVGVLGILFLVAVRSVNTRYKKQLRFSIPGELLVVVFATLVSHLADLEQRYDVKVLGKLEAGLPTPALPSLAIAGQSFGDIFVAGIAISIVSYVISVSIVKTIGSQLGYETDSNQEFVALGAANIVGSLFSCYPSAGSLSRSAVVVASGGNTPLATLISGGIMIIVVVALIPLFEAMPNAILASVILVALRGMLMQYKQFFSLLHVNRSDAFMWLWSFLSTVVFNVGPGVGISVLSSLLVTAYSAAHTDTTELGWVRRTQLYRDVKRYDNLVVFPGLLILRFHASLSYITREAFHSAVTAHLDTRLRPQTSSGRWGRAVIAGSSGGAGGAGGAGGGDSKDADSPANIADTGVGVGVQWLVLDCTAMNGLDSSGIKELHKMLKLLQARGCRLLLAAPRGSVRDVLHRDGFLSEIGVSSLFVSTHAAVSFALNTAPPSVCLGSATDAGDAGGEGKSEESGGAGEGAQRG